MVASALAALAPFSVGAFVPTDPSAFSAVRAKQALERLIGTGQPHPVGSRENRAVRTRLEQQLASLGLEPTVHSKLSCGGFGLCARVENVLVEIPGEQRSGAIALAAHYDSVPAGPGASDDGAGVASLLEIARALVHGPKLRRSVWLWFTDGEEMGLLGARALVSEPSLWQNVSVVVNVEARGTRGPSLMFESSTPNDGLIDAFARSVRRPVAGSTFYAVYRSLPNDTDLTVFRNAGLTGLNLAFIGGATRYHTPGDALASLSQRSLQHEGEQALALVRTFAREGAPKSTTDAVFFDLFSRAFFHVSVPRARLMTLVLLLLGFGAVAWFCSRRGLRPKPLALATLVPLLVPIAAGVVTLPVQAALAWRGALDQPWPATTWAIFCGCASLAAAALLFVVSRLVRRIDVDLAFAGLWLFELWVSGLLALVLPEALPLFALPALALTLASLARMRVEAPLANLALSLPVLVNAVLWAPIVALAVLALGVLAPGVQSALVALLLLPLVPLFFACSSRVVTRGALGCAGLAVFFFACGLVLPSADASAPARVNLGYQADVTTQKARYLLQAERVPSALGDRLRFQENEDDQFPWFGATQVASFRADAPWRGLPGPTASLAGEHRTPRGRDLHIAISAGASDALALIIGLPRERLLKATMDDASITALDVGELATFGVVCPHGPVRLGLQLSGSEPVPLRVVELHSGLPEGSAALQRARDIAATASQTGDITAVSRDERF